ncbi:UBX domain-domain-containing protein [Protomyces lactucae-debilis]|uniref:UBX domain-domain-containing protein n=1 Tax=Protomyces lactucae-debilis TaxID=2754530 RepID=A0A1Y2FQI0_PROLT|nr:UBX domain-containing protein [Protomyces lactucae-debilis]ORY86262.1 UBX domain-domain-containing protein [Protomyces lactucae-debilis]
MFRYLLSLPLKLLFSFLRLVSGSKPYRNLTADDASRNYIQTLETAQSEEHLPLLTTSYLKAVEQAKRELKFLLVVLTSSHHDDSSACKSQILCSTALRSFVQDHQILCWAGDAAENEGFHTASSLGATRFPFFAVLVYNTLRSPAGVSTVCRVEGLVEAAVLIETLTEAIDRFEPTLIAARLDQREQNASREIRREQDSAYERSLAADRRRAEEARLAEERKARELAAALEATRQRAVYRVWRHAKILPEPTSGEHVARVSFRLPDGSRIVRKFDAQCPVEELYAFVDAKINPVSVEEREQAGDSPSGPAEGNYRYSFTLAVPMPRKLVDCAQDAKIIDQREVFPSGSLIVEALEEEEATSP